MKSLRFNYATRYVCVRMIFSHHHGEKGCVYVYSTRSQSELHRNQSIFLAKLVFMIQLRFCYKLQPTIKNKARIGSVHFGER